MFSVYCKDFISLTFLSWCLILALVKNRNNQHVLDIQKLLSEIVVNGGLLLYLHICF